MASNFTVRYLSSLLVPVLLAGCGSNHPTVDTVQLRIREMVSAKYSAYKAANNLPDNAGVMVHLVTPAGNTTYALGIGNSAVGMGHSGAHPDDRKKQHRQDVDLRFNKWV